MSKNNKYFCPVTMGIIIITSVVTILQFVYPEILSILRRDPRALAAGEWWRIITPLLVHDEGWWQYLFNISCIGSIGIAVERLYGKVKFLILYLAGGLAGEIVGYVGWDPYGAGASVGLCGLLGGLYVLMIRKKSPLYPISAMLSVYIVVGLVSFASGSIYVSIGLFMASAILMAMILKQNRAHLLSSISSSVGLLGGMILILLHDIHGASILAGASTSFIFLLKKVPIDFLGEE